MALRNRHGSLKLDETSVLLRNIHRIFHFQCTLNCMFGTISNVLAYKHNINTNMSHNALNIRIIASFVANDINTYMSHMYGKCFSKRQNKRVKRATSTWLWRPFFCKYVAWPLILYATSKISDIMSVIHCQDATLIVYQIFDITTWFILPPTLILPLSHHFGKTCLVQQPRATILLIHSRFYTLPVHQHIWYNFFNWDILLLIWDYIPDDFFFWGMLTTSSTWFFLPKQVENGECKLNLGSHDKNCAWLPRYRWWANLPSGSSYPTLPYTQN